MVLGHTYFEMRYILYEVYKSVNSLVCCGPRSNRARLKYLKRGYGNFVGLHLFLGRHRDHEMLGAYLLKEHVDNR